MAEWSRAPERGFAPHQLHASKAALLKPQPAIVFSHADGFPAGTYRLLFEAWRATCYRVHAVEKYGHDPRFPVTSNWPHLRDQLLHCIEQEADLPVFLVGHSLGGYLSLLAASRRPEGVRGVVLLDSPILGGLKAHAVRVGKATGAVKRFSPGRVWCTGASTGRTPKQPTRTSPPSRPLPDGRPRCCTTTLPAACRRLKVAPIAPATV